MVGLEGGEFVLHPEAEQILDWFHKHHSNFTLLSNCLAPDKVMSFVKRYRPKHLYVSLDGTKETYLRMRGRDGYDKVFMVMNACKDIVPLSLMFCLSPWNTLKDMEHVIHIAKTHGVDVRIGIYSTMSFFDTTAGMMEAKGTSFINQIPPSIHETSENYDFVALYDEWKNQRLKLRCHSIFSQAVIHSNGDVPLCQNLNVVLGNIHNSSLDDILNSQDACKAQCEYSNNCNKCWINYHRKYDIILLKNLERVFPKWLIELFYGKYQWTQDRHTTYKQHFKHIAPRT